MGGRGSNPAIQLTVGHGPGVMYDRGGQHRVRLGQSHAPVPLHGQRLRGALRSVTMTGFRAEETRWEANLVMLDGGALFLPPTCTGSDLVLAGNWFEGNTATGNGGHRLGTGRACREGHGRPRVRGTWRGALLPSGPQHDPAPLQPARQPLRGRGPGGHPTDQLTVSRWTYSTSSASSPPRSAPPTRAASRRHLIHGRPWDHLPVLASSRASGGAAGARSLTVTDCEFAGSQALRQGGAIAVSTCTTMHLANSSFTANLAVAPTVSPCSMSMSMSMPMSMSVNVFRINAPMLPPSVTIPCLRVQGEPSRPTSSRAAGGGLGVRGQPGRERRGALSAAGQAGVHIAHTAMTTDPPPPPLYGAGCQSVPPGSQPPRLCPCQAPAPQAGSCSLTASHSPLPALRRDAPGGQPGGGGGPGPGCTLAQNTASDERGAIYYKAGGAASS
ncbi:hypothetical protein PAPYR_13336 [Paratrimastix pyriformis]|uniref:Uncharacterized protein n=1 Tax=Paratrimastix pyriformis TaxID=342808 RepID=A0ABQ8U3Y9_9EUKA|nr:hypothetical protein PAPYR_13336 [Paratrimastix pyriformis]